MGCVADPVGHFGPVLFFKFAGQVDQVKVLDRVEFVGILFQIREPPLQIVDEGDDQPEGRFGGGAHGQPGTAGVHHGELPVLLAVLLGDQGPNHRLAFVEGQHVLGRAGGRVPQRGGFDQEIQDRWHDLVRDHRRRDLDGGKVGVREHDGNLEAADMRIVVGSDAAVIGKRQSVIAGHDEQGLVRNALLRENVHNLRQPVVDEPDGVQILVEIVLGLEVLVAHKVLVAVVGHPPRMVRRAGQMGDEQALALSLGVVDRIAKVLAQLGVRVSIVVDLLGLDRPVLGAGAFQLLLGENVLEPQPRRQLVLLVVALGHRLHPFGVPGPRREIVGAVRHVNLTRQGVEDMRHARLVDVMLVLAVEIRHQWGNAAHGSDQALERVGARGEGIAGADAAERLASIVCGRVARKARVKAGEILRRPGQIGQFLLHGMGNGVVRVGIGDAIPHERVLAQREDVGAGALQFQQDDVFDAHVSAGERLPQGFQHRVLEIGDVQRILGRVVMQRGRTTAPMRRPVMRSRRRGMIVLESRIPILEPGDRIARQPIPPGRLIQRRATLQPAVVTRHHVGIDR